MSVEAGRRFGHLDVGGEGKYPDAANLNPASEGAHGPIPNRISGRAESNGLDDGCADHVSAESIPLHHPGVVEGIVRLVAPGGTVRLENPSDFRPAAHAHERLRELLGGDASSRVVDGVLVTVIRNVKI